MVLWTIQPVEVWDELKNKGYFICDPAKSKYLSDEEWNFGTAYDWLVEQMESRIGGKPEDVNYPIWAWHIYDWKCQPDNFIDTDEKELVCLKIDIPEKDVLLHDYDAWHYVLSNVYFDNSKNEVEWKSSREKFDSLSQSEQEQVKRESWEAIFDITPFENKWCCRGKYVQATFWILRRKDVVAVYPYPLNNKKGINVYERAC